MMSDKKEMPTTGMMGTEEHLPKFNLHSTRFTAPLPSLAIRYSRGKSTYDNQPEQREAQSWTELWDAIANDKGTAKGQQYICGPMRLGNHSDKNKYPDVAHYRRKERAEDCVFLPFDFDNIPKDIFEPLLDLLADYSGCSYTTSSHSPEKPRARAFIALSRPVSRNERMRLGLTFERYVLSRDVVGVKFDPAVYKSEQQCYLPLKNAEFYDHKAQTALDVDGLLNSEFALNEDAAGASVAGSGYVSNGFNTLPVDEQLALLEEIKAGIKAHKVVGKNKGFDSAEARKLAEDVTAQGAKLCLCWQFNDDSLAGVLGELTKDDVNSLNRDQWIARIVLAARFAPVGSDDAERIKAAMRKWSEKHSCYEGYLAVGNDAPELDAAGGKNDPFVDFENRWREGECSSHAENNPFRKLSYRANTKMPVPDVFLADGTVYSLFEVHHEPIYACFDGLPDPQLAIDPIEQVNQKFAWDSRNLLLYSRQSRMYIPESSFKTNYLNQQVMVGERSQPLGNAWLTSSRRLEVNGLRMAPDEGAITKSGELNTWLGYSVSPVEGDLDPFLCAFAYLFPDAGDKDFVLAFLAKMIQRPEARFNVALGVYGEVEGTGKNTIFEAVGSLFHPHHFKVISGSELDRDFNEWQLDKVFVLGDEVSNAGDRRLADKVKRMVTGTSNHINPKHKPAFEQPNLIKYVFLSNHEEILHINDHDRRYYIAKTSDERLPALVADNFYEWKANGGLSHLLHFLMNYDCSSFDPTKPAPMTEAKKEVIDAGRSGLESWVEQIIPSYRENGQLLVSTSELISAYGQTSDKAVGNALITGGARKLKKRAMGSNKQRHRLFALGDIERFEAMSETQLGKEWLEQRLSRMGARSPA